MNIKPVPHPAILKQIATDVGTPAYVYFEDIIRRQCRKMKDATAGIPIKLLYAMKANFQPAVLDVILDEGFGLDVVSPGEWLLAERLGFQPENVLYSANNISSEELSWIAQTGLLINFGELNRLQDFGKNHPGRDVSLRINPEIGSGHHEYVVTAGSKTKFGIPVSQLKTARDIAERYDLKVISLHEHIGSGFNEIEPWWAAMEVMLDLATEFPDLRYINFGGGLGIPYHANDQPIALERFATEMGGRLMEWRLQHHPNVTFMFEPGRFLVAEAGVLLARVTSVKKTADRTFVGTDTGQNHLIRPMLYSAYHEIVNISNPDGPRMKCDVTGNICETGDRLATDRELTEVSEGDILAILDTGAYGMSMASWYNLRSYPAEVMVDHNNQIVRVRERPTPAEMVDSILHAITVHAR